MQIKKIVNILSEMAVLIIKREPPFNQLPIYEEVCSNQYLYYLRYSDEIGSTLKKKVLKAEIDRAQFQIKKKIIGVDISFANKFPQHMETRNEFWEWINKKLMGTNAAGQAMMGQINPGIDIRKELKKNVELKMPLFQLKKNSKYRGYICFEKEFLDTKILMIADKGKKRSFVSYFLGLEQPNFLIDVALLFSGVQSTFWYSSKEDVIQGIDRAINLLSFIMPYFESALIDALKE